MSLIGYVAGYLIIWLFGFPMVISALQDLITRPYFVRRVKLVYINADSTKKRNNAIIWKCT